MNRLETEPSTNGEAKPAEAPPQLPGVHPSIRSRCWRTATEYSLHSEPVPNWLHRLCQRLLLGWRWEAVVVVVPVKQQPKPE